MGKQQRKIKKLKQRLRKVTRDQANMLKTLSPPPVSPDWFTVGTKWTTHDAASYEMLNHPEKGISLIKPVRNNVTLEIKEIDTLQQGVMMARLQMYADSGDYEDNGLLHLDLRTGRAKIVETGPHLTKHSQSSIYTQGDLSVSDLQIHPNGDLEGLFYTDIQVRGMYGLKLSHEYLARHVV